MQLFAWSSCLLRAPSEPVRLHELPQAFGTTQQATERALGQLQSHHFLQARSKIPVLFLACPPSHKHLVPRQCICRKVSLLHFSYFESHKQLLPFYWTDSK